MKNKKLGVALTLALSVTMVLNGGVAWAHHCAASPGVRQGTATSPNEGIAYAFGTAASDFIDCSGSSVTHVIRGHGGNDRLIGGSGRDLITGGDGHDDIYGGDDADTLIGEAGNDRINGGSGDDLIIADDGEADLIDCGPGYDTVFYDVGLDRIVNCENLNPEEAAFTVTLVRGFPE